MENRFLKTKEKSYILQHSRDIEKLLKQSYWANKRSLETIEKSIENSLSFAIVDKETDTIIAFARAVTDYTTIYYLADVIVATDYRGCGLGKEIVGWITQEELAGVKGLLLTSNAEKLYEKYGFADYSGHSMCKF